MESIRAYEILGNVAEKAYRTGKFVVDRLTVTPTEEWNKPPPTASITYYSNETKEQ